MANSENRKFLIALSHFPKFGAKSLAKLIKHFPDLGNAFSATLPDFLKAGLRENIALEFLDFRRNLCPDRIFERLEKENIRTVTVVDEEYPPLLKEIFDPPLLLFYKGIVSVPEEINFAVVGTRRFTSYGQRISEKLTAELSLNGFTIVSGLALGVDTLAHNAVVGLNKRTLAVLGTGIDSRSLYPPANRYLAEKIVANGGALISEFPLGAEPLAFHFPQRNRVIAGLSIGTLVIEAGEKSGALITARFALEQNREVFAVPGSIFSPVSIGPNNLIKQGAKSVTQIEDILETLDFKAINTYIDNKKMIPKTEEERIIAEMLDHEPRHINEIIRQSRLTTSQISSTLTIMEIKGMVRDIGGRNYILI